ncbi:hypothetical protein EsDP_00003220 [Epichloe bromicola]|uniref:Integral membrane protein n=1 Tax=Epichloe bromicola TaxID=79588 RepID=A0ABQ0CN27_9HYPO
MDSFMKAAKLGLAKTVAAGQQQLQQRLAKYEQPRSQSQSGGNPYSSGQHQHGQQSHAQYHGVQNQNQHSSQTPATQHSQYPPPPGSTTQQTPYQQHAYSAPLGHGKHQYYVPPGQNSYGNGTTAASPSEHGYAAVSPHGQGQYGSHTTPPPPLPPRPYQCSKGASNASVGQHLEASGSATAQYWHGEQAANNLTQGVGVQSPEQQASYNWPPLGSNYRNLAPSNTYYSPPPQANLNNTPGSSLSRSSSPPPNQQPSNGSPHLRSSSTSAASPSNTNHASLKQTSENSTQISLDHGSTSRLPSAHCASPVQQPSNNSSHPASGQAAVDSSSDTNYLLPLQSASSASPQSSQTHRYLPPLSRTYFPPPPSESSTYTPVQPGRDTYVSLAPAPPISPRANHNLQPQSEPRQHAEPTSVANHWENRAIQAQNTEPSSNPPHQPHTISNGIPVEAQASRKSTPATNNDVSVPPASLPVAESIPSQPAAASSPSALAYAAGLANETSYMHQSLVGDDPAAVTQTMSNLSINNKQRLLAQSPPERAFNDFNACKLPPVVASGTPRDVVRYCPGDRVVDYPLYWYHLPEEPEFLICTKCHDDHIKCTPLENQFERILTAPGSQSTCRFRSPRVKDFLWKQALRTRNLEILRSFMKSRLSIPNCRGRATVLGKEKIKWYGMANNEINGFIACEACYEDKIIGTSFQSHFMPFREQGPKDEWTCNAALSYVTRAIEQLSKSNDWSGFVSSANRRLLYPACEGKDIAWNEGVWFTTRRKIDNFHVCGACYMDRLELTAFEHEFEPVNTEVGFDVWMQMIGTRWTCKLPSSNIPMSFVHDTFLANKDFDGFWNMTSVVNTLVPCTAKGIIRGSWWTIPGGCPDFSLCEACYNGVFKSSDLSKFLEPATRDPENPIVCSFCPAVPRFNQYISKFAEAMDRSVFSYYTDYIKTFAHVPTCPGLDHRENSTWWGYDQALFCQDCYLTFVADTKLGDHLQYYDASDGRAQICQIWSPRMRQMWLEACNAGPPGSAESNGALDKFKAFGERRLQIFNQTVPRIKFIKGMKEMKMMNAMQQGQLSLMYAGMNSMAVLSDTTDGYEHGNSSVGWFETEHGATGAQMFNNMQAGFADANRMDEWAQIFQLQMMWSEVE